VILTKSNEFKIVAEDAAVDVAASDVIAIGQRDSQVLESADWF